MNIHYRIVKVDPGAHSVLVRYWTDKVTEMDLAGPINEDGTPMLNADGYPLGCRTDVLITLYDTPTLSPEELDKRIMMQAPTDWLKLQEDIKDSSIDTSMKELRNLVGDTKAFTTDEVKTLREQAIANNEINAATTEEHSLVRAYELVGSLTDSIKVLAGKDPAVLSVLANAISSITSSST